jgi:hypothetical protein
MVETVVEALAGDAIITVSHFSWHATMLLNGDKAELQALAESEVHVDWLVDVSCSHSITRSASAARFGKALSCLLS